MDIERKIASIITEEINKTELVDKLKKDKDFEKHVKQIVSDVIKDLFRVMYQHNNIFKTLSR